MSWILVSTQSLELDINNILNISWILVSKQSPELDNNKYLEHEFNTCIKTIPWMRHW